MGWGRFFLLGDLGQQLDLSDQRRELDKLRLQIRSRRRAALGIEQQVSELQSDADELRLFLAATVRLLVSKGIVAEQDLARMRDEIERALGERMTVAIRQVDDIPLTPSGKRRVTVSLLDRAGSAETTVASAAEAEP